MAGPLRPLRPLRQAQGPGSGTGLWDQALGPVYGIGNLAYYGE